MPVMTDPPRGGAGRVTHEDALRACNKAIVLSAIAFDLATSADRALSIGADNLAKTLMGIASGVQADAAMWQAEAKMFEVDRAIAAAPSETIEALMKRARG